VKLQATVTFEFQASSLVDAGHKVNDAVEHAREADDMEAKSIEIRTPPGGPPVTLPLVAGQPHPAPTSGNSGV
jgi:hypothetical protein